MEGHLLAGFLGLLASLAGFFLALTSASACQSGKHFELAPRKQPLLDAGSTSDRLRHALLRMRDVQKQLL